MSWHLHKLVAFPDDDTDTNDYNNNNNNNNDYYICTVSQILNELRFKVPLETK